MSAAMSCTGRRLLPIIAIIAVGAQLSPAIARADLHNITYRARIDALTTGSQATFIINGGQTNTTNLPSMPGNAFEANTVLPDPAQAGMRIVLHFPCSASERLCFAAASGSTADVFCGTWAATGLMVISRNRVNKIMRFIKIKWGRWGGRLPHYTCSADAQ